MHIKIFPQVLTNQWGEKNLLENDSKIITQTWNHFVLVHHLRASSVIWRVRLDHHYELLINIICDDGKVIWRIWGLVMSFLWSWGGTAVGTEFEIIATCLPAVQMLMSLLCLIIKEASLRERQSKVASNPGTFKKPAFCSTFWLHPPALS